MCIIIKRCFLIFALTVCAASTSARDWAEYRSENFTIYSDEKAQQIEALLLELESFRRLVFLSLGMAPRVSNSTLKIFVYDRARDYNNLGNEKSLGFFLDTSAGPRMVVSYSRKGVNQAEVLYHEYVHYLLREHSSIYYPKWHREGFAEFMAASTIRDGVATIGNIYALRADALRSQPLLPLRELLTQESEEDLIFYQERFYARSWLLLHFLLMEVRGEHPEFAPQLATFLSRYNDNVGASADEIVELFESSFDMPVETMDGLLKQYQLQKRKRLISLDVPAYEGEIVVRSLSE